MKNKDGTYDFILKFHNGGCSLSDAIEEALNGLEK